MLYNIIDSKDVLSIRRFYGKKPTAYKTHSYFGMIVALAHLHTALFIMLQHIH